MRDVESLLRVGAQNIDQLVVHLQRPRDVDSDRGQRHVESAALLPTQVDRDVVPPLVGLGSNDVGGVQELDKQGVGGAEYLQGD